MYVYVFKLVVSWLVVSLLDQITSKMYVYVFKLVVSWLVVSLLDLIFTEKHVYIGFLIYCVLNLMKPFNNFPEFSILSKQSFNWSSLMYFRSLEMYNCVSNSYNEPLAMLRN